MEEPIAQSRIGDITEIEARHLGDQAFEIGDLDGERAKSGPKAPRNGESGAAVMIPRVPLSFVDLVTDAEARLAQRDRAFAFLAERTS